MILAHLDLDAFYAAVEELENPELKSQPLVVGGDPRGRGVVATANYVARTFGIHSAMSAAEAIRRCPHAVFVRPRHTLYREYSRHVWSTVRGIVPTVEQTGVTRATSIWARWRATSSRRASSPRRCRPLCARARRLTCSLGVAPCKVVAKVASDARKPGGLTVVRAGTGSVVPRTVRRAAVAGRRAEGGGAVTARRRRDVGALAALSDEQLRALLPGSVGVALRDRARGIDPRGLELDVQRVSISSENTFERDVTDREWLHGELRRQALEVAESLQKRGEVARTVTTKLRYADFSIRSRSTSLEHGIDDAEQIGDLACRLLDRGLHDRPGALRLVGVGVSGLGAFRQLTLV